MKRVHYLQLLVLLTLLLVALTMTRRFGAPTPTVDEAGTTQTAAVSTVITATLVSTTATPSGVPATVITVTDVAPTLPTAAQPGGIFIQGVAAAPDRLNPLFATNATALAIIDKLFPAIVGQDATTGAANTAGVAEKWRFSNNGQTLTLTLYPALLWSDGAPLTAQDVAFTYAALLEPTLASPYRDNFANLAAVTVLDEQQVELQLRTPDCTILQSLHQPLLPAHLFVTDAAPVATSRLDSGALNPATVDFDALKGDELLLRNPVSGGPFLLESWAPAGPIRLVRNPNYRRGVPLLAGWEVRVIPDADARLQALESGAVDLVQLTAAQFDQAPGLVAVTFYTAPLDSVTFVALNLADPAAPQPGRGADDTVIPQTPHPILGTLAVRQALALGLDYEPLLANVYGASALPLTSYTLPTVAWAYNGDLIPNRYALAAAAQLLTNAGWVDSDGDGVRERAGTRLRLSLLTNEDSPARVQLGQQLRTQWAQLGVEVTFQATPFETVTRTLLAQRSDMVLIGWDNLGAEPANSDFWHSRQDLPVDDTGAAGDNNGATGGANFVSYQNVAVDQWLDDARTTPDCDGGYRAFTYRRIQERIHEDLPYLVLGGQQQGWAYRQRWQGLDPQPWDFTHNVQRWWLP